MNKIQVAICDITSLENASLHSNYFSKLHPLVKVLITLWYLLLVISIPMNCFHLLLGMSLYPILTYQTNDLSIKETLYRLRVTLPLFLLLGITQPFFDQTEVFVIGTLTITNGMITMISILVKGLLCLLASSLLIQTTSMEQICYALGLIHVPALIITMLLFIYRYLHVFLQEYEISTQAYSLRAPKQQGIHWKAWGPMIGLLLLRTIDRATEVYQSMCLRGYHGGAIPMNTRRLKRYDWLSFLLMGTLLLIFRIFPIFEFIGQLFM